MPPGNDRIWGLHQRPRPEQSRAPQCSQPPAVIKGGLSDAFSTRRPPADSRTTMILSRFAPLVLLPFAAAGVHKLKLQKLSPAANDLVFESDHLASKYGGQVPLMGAGGLGRQVRLSNPNKDDGLLWTQEEFGVNGGHNVPLTSQ